MPHESSGLDAIRSYIKNSFPGVTRTYVNSVPENFIRPAFYAELISTVDTDLSRDLYNRTETWQIKYFSPKDDAGCIDIKNGYEVGESLSDGIKNQMFLSAPDGTIYTVSDITKGIKDGEVYVNLVLEIQRKRNEMVYDNMSDIKFGIKLEEE